MTSFNDAIGDWRDRLNLIRRIPFEFKIPEGKIPLMRKIERFPYVPADRAGRDQRCYEVYNIQVHGLMKRLDSTGIKQVVIGVSGGLDSTQALIVCARAMDRLGLPRENILGYTRTSHLFRLANYHRATAPKQFCQNAGRPASFYRLRPPRSAA